MLEQRICEQNEKSKAIIHDECLEYESNIWNYVEQLGDQRVKNYESGKIEDIDLIIPILNSISDEVERYKEWIKWVGKKEIPLVERFIDNHNNNLK